MTKNNKKKPKNKKKKKNYKLFLIWTSLLVLIIVAITLFLMSDLFNIKEIKILDNSRISSDEIKSLSELQINENMFKFLKLNVEEKIKTNPYIEKVEIHRKLNRNN